LELLVKDREDRELENSRGKGVKKTFSSEKANDETNTALRKVGSNMFYDNIISLILHEKNATHLSTVAKHIPELIDNDPHFVQYLGQQPTDALIEMIKNLCTLSHYTKS